MNGWSSWYRRTKDSSRSSWGTACTSNSWNSLPSTSRSLNSCRGHCLPRKLSLYSSDRPFKAKTCRSSSCRREPWSSTQFAMWRRFINSRTQSPLRTPQPSKRMTTSCRWRSCRTRMSSCTWRTWRMRAGLISSSKKSTCCKRNRSNRNKHPSAKDKLH